MADDPIPTPLELLQRAQFLHDSTLRWHSEALARHDTELLLLRQMAESQIRVQHDLRDLQTRLTDNQISFAATLASQGARLAALEDIAQRLTTTLETIKDLLNRPPNGH
jgi:hypothetical protein